MTRVSLFLLLLFNQARSLKHKKGGEKKERGKAPIFSATFFSQPAQLFLGPPLSFFLFSFFSFLSFPPPTFLQMTFRPKRSPEEKSFVEERGRRSKRRRKTSRPLSGSAMPLELQFEASPRLFSQAASTKQDSGNLMWPLPLRRKRRRRGEDRGQLRMVGREEGRRWALFTQPLRK